MEKKSENRPYGAKVTVARKLANPEKRISELCENTTAVPCQPLTAVPLHVELKISAKEQDGQLGSVLLPILCSIDLSFCSICLEEVLVSFLV